jgi:hypothetical protein
VDGAADAAGSELTPSGALHLRERNPLAVQLIAVAEALRERSGTVGWVPPHPSFSIDKPNEFHRQTAAFVVAFCISFKVIPCAADIANLASNLCRAWRPDVS